MDTPNVLLLTHIKNELNNEKNDFEQQEILHIRTILDIVFTKNGRNLYPYAIIEPLDLNNQTINRIFLYDAKYLLDHDIQINDNLLFKDDIFKFEIMKSPNRKRLTITKCPICKSDLIYDSPHLYCSNLNCMIKKIKIQFNLNNVSIFSSFSFQILKNKTKKQQLKICISGNLDESECNYNTLINRFNVIIHERLKSDTDILVTDETNTVKIRLAKQAKIPILTSRFFLNYLKDKYVRN